MNADRVVKVTITPRMHEIARAVEVALTAPDHPEPKRSEMLDTFFKRHAAQDLMYLLRKLGLRDDG